jgi:signal transduction histidine kinase
LRDAVNRLLLLAAAGAGAVAPLIELFLARHTTGPLAELAADELAAGNRDRRAQVSSPDELGAPGPVVQCHCRRRGPRGRTAPALVADIAHELRSPLAILQGQLEAVQDGITRPNPQLIASRHAESLRMGQLVAAAVAHLTVTVPVTFRWIEHM